QAARENTLNDSTAATAACLRGGTDAVSRVESGAFSATDARAIAAATHTSESTPPDQMSSGSGTRNGSHGRNSSSSGETARAAAAATTPASTAARKFARLKAYDSGLLAARRKRPEPRSALHHKP